MTRPKPDVRLSADREIVPQAKVWRWIHIAFWPISIGASICKALGLGKRT